MKENKYLLSVNKTEFNNIINSEITESENVVYFENLFCDIVTIVLNKNNYVIKILDGAVSFSIFLENYERKVLYIQKNAIITTNIVSDKEEIKINKFAFSNNSIVDTILIFYFYYYLQLEKFLLITLNEMNEFEYTFMINIMEYIHNSYDDNNWYNEFNINYCSYKATQQDGDYNKNKLTEFKKSELKKIKYKRKNDENEEIVIIPSEIMKYEYIKKTCEYMDRIGEKQLKNILQESMTVLIKNVTEDSTIKVCSKIFYGLRIAVKFDTNKKSQNIYNDIYVGLKLNKMRKLIPNFMCTFGYYIDKSSRVYCLSEYINNTTSIIDFLNESDDKNFINILLIIYLSLRMAFIKYKFTHYDLHLKNILLKKLMFEEQYKYEYKDRYLIFEVDHVPVIIDYGLSCIEGAEQNVGSFRHIFIDSEPNIMCDYHKIFYSIVIECSVLRSKYSNTIEKIHHLFHPDINMKEMLSKDYIKEFYFNIPRHNKIGQLESADYIIDNLIKL